MSDTNKIKIKLLGTPGIFVEGQAIMLKRKKSRAIVFYLATRRNPVSRQELVEILWPQFERTTALKNLSTYVHNIRCAIPDMIKADKNHLTLAPHVEIDAKQLDEYCICQKYDEESARMVDKLYRGTFLKHFHVDDSDEFEQWKDSQAEYYLNQVINYKYAVAGQLMNRAKYQEALERLNQIIKLDPYREDVYKLAMKANCKVGNRPGAIKLFEQLSNLLKEELGISPMPDTIRLYSDLITEDILGIGKSQIPQVKVSEEESVMIQTTIKDIIEKLSPSARMLLQLMAVCQDKFDLKIMSSILNMTENDVFTLLDELTMSRALTIGADNSIVFLNQGEKEYIYTQISPPQRKYLHFRVGKAIEEFYESTYDSAKVMLFHYQRSGENHLTLRAAMQVGQMAIESGDFYTAIECYEQACFYLTGRDQMELIEYISQLLFLTGDYKESKNILLKYADIAGKDFQLGIESCFRLQAHLTIMPEYVESIWGGVKPQYAVKVDKEDGINLWMGERYLQNEEENLNFYIMFLYCKASYLEMQMKFAEAKECFEKVLKLSIDHPNAWLITYISCCYLKLGLYEVNPAKAEEYLSMGIAYAGEKKNRRNLPLLLAASSEHDIRQGRLEVARKNLDWADSLVRKYNNPYMEESILIARAHLELAKENKAEAVDILRNLLKISCESDSRYMTIAVCKELLKLEEGRRYWSKCRDILSRFQTKDSGMIIE